MDDISESLSSLLAAPPLVLALVLALAALGLAAFAIHVVHVSVNRRERH